MGNWEIKTVGMEDLKNRRIGELSGGELQRVFIAKSLFVILHLHL